MRLLITSEYRSALRDSLSTEKKQFRLVSVNSSSAIYYPSSARIVVKDYSGVTNIYQSFISNQKALGVNNHFLFLKAIFAKNNVSLDLQELLPHETPY